jgi:hypothetical protein
MSDENDVEDVMNILAVTDPFMDPDDLVALSMLINAHMKREINIALVIVNRFTILEALRTAGFFKYMNQHDIPICHGKNTSVKPIYEYDGQPFINAETNEISTDYIETLRSVLTNLPNKKTYMILISSPTEISEFIDVYPDLFADKIEKVSFMSAIDVVSVDEKNVVKPSDISHNNTADNENTIKHATNLIDFLANRRIPLFITTKQLTINAKSKLTLYDVILENISPKEEKWRQCIEFIKINNIVIIEQFYQYVKNGTVKINGSFEERYEMTYHPDGSVTFVTFMPYDAHAVLVMFHPEIYKLKQVSDNCYVTDDVVSIDVVNAALVKSLIR